MLIFCLDDEDVEANVVIFSRDDELEKMLAENAKSKSQLVLCSTKLRCIHFFSFFLFLFLAIIIAGALLSESLSAICCDSSWKYSREFHAMEKSEVAMARLIIC